jgi:uncharacterized RDD family membrane protein YckC
MSEAPPPLKPGNVLDSVFRDGGPMPSARLGIRALAFLLDFILLTAVATVIIWKIAMPQAHPGAFTEFNEWSQEFVHWLSESGTQQGAVPPQWSEELTQALAYARDLQLLIFWFYFAIGEAFFGGSSLGKRACRLRSVSTVTLGPPPIMAGIVRGGLKTMALFFAFPFALLATIGALFFNQRRQMGHDLLSRTAVIDEKYLNLQEKT